jgi:hypothetical protein
VASRRFEASNCCYGVLSGRVFPGENTSQFKLCNNCYKVCKKKNIPPMGRRNGYAYPLLHYSDLVDYLGLEGELSVPMVIVGDFNISKDNRAKLKEHLSKHFHLELKNDPAEQTTLSGSCIALTFSRYTRMHLICKPYVSYFSYHYPVFNKITL